LSFNDYLPNGRSDGRSSPPAAKKFAFLSAQWREVKAGSRKILQNRSMRGHFLNIRKNGSGYSKLVLQALCLSAFCRRYSVCGQKMPASGKQGPLATMPPTSAMSAPISVERLRQRDLAPPIEFTTTQVMR
jgi:hypothetical protein